jgi:ubiquinone/menaquinone biosynthesis C-methylase UbiE
MPALIRSAADDSDDPQRLAAEHVIATERLCAGLLIPAGARVLDIGCGTGHAAIAAARRRAVVTGIDINEESLSRARLRAEAEALDGIDFIRADAAAMPFPDANFDFVVSSLGLVFLPDQEGAARELARVVRPGGAVGLTAYTRQSIPSQVYDLVTGIFHNPAKPPRAHYEWSDGQRVGELLNPYFRAIRVTYDSYDTCFTSSAASFEHVSRWNPNLRKALIRGDESKVNRLREGYLAILDRHNRATDGSFMANMDYAVISAVRAG